jgi:hypothetical protein
MRPTAQTVKRAFLLVYRAIKFRSISSAYWVDAYESFKPTHGGKQ